MPVDDSISAATTGKATRDLLSLLKSRLTRRQVLLGCLGFLVFVAMLFLGGTDALRSLASASPAYVMLAFLTTLALTSTTARRWGDLTNMFVGRSVGSFWGYYQSLILSRAAGLIIPQGIGDLGLRPLLHNAVADSSLSDAFSGVLVERLLDGTLILASGLPSLLYLVGAIPVSAFTGILVSTVALWFLLFVALGGLTARLLSRFLAWASDRLSGRVAWFSRAVAWAAEMTESLSVAAQSGSLLRRVAVLSVVRYALVNLQFLLIARSLGLPEIGLVEILAALPAAQIGMLVAITPGGLGFLEGGFWGALTAMKIAPATVKAFLVGQRVLLGVFTLLLATLSVAPMICRRGSSECSES